MATNGQAGLTVTIGAVVALTLDPSKVPPPHAGSAPYRQRIESELRAAGFPTRVEEVCTITVTRPNPHAAVEPFRPDLFRVVDGEGRPMEDRQIEVQQHEGVSHPYELMLFDGRTAKGHSYGYFASSFDAAAVGRLWQRGLLDVRIDDLPEAMLDIASSTSGSA